MLTTSEYNYVLAAHDFVQCATWYTLAARGHTPRDIINAGRLHYVPSDITHAVRELAKRQCLPVPESCERKKPYRPRGKK